MKVLAVEQYRDVGGGQMVFLHAIDCLLRMGAAVEAAAPLGGSLEAAIRERFGARVACHPIPQPDLTSGRKTAVDGLRMAAYSAGLLGLRKKLSSFQYVYVNGSRLFPAFLALSTVARARFVYHVHLDHSRMEKAVIGAVARHPRTHAVLANSEFVRHRLERTLGKRVAHARLRVVENSLDRRLSSLAFTDRWMGARRLNVVAIGRLIPEKGHDVVIDLAARFPDIHFHLLGDADPERPDGARRLRARAGSNVSFHGRVDDVAATIQALGAQINVVPSRREESFGLAAIEGMACSCLTITSGQGGLADISAQTGAWMAANPAEWEGAIEKIRVSRAEELTSIARDQHDRTQRRYAYDRFERDFGAVFR